MKSNHNYSSRFRILKGGKISLVVSALLGSVTLSFAAPSGGVVTSGNATIDQVGKTTNINQSTSKASINWQKFGIKADEVVNFIQPDKNSITLNRVIGNERSIIDGALNANGQVWILNSNGVLFGKNASINTSGLLATTKNLSDTDFQSGNYNFSGDSTESIINQGTIKIKDNGYVILASNEVRNSGEIEAVKGRVQLTGADEYTINLNGNSLVDLVVDKGTLDALVENSSTILADGGEVYLTTHAVDELLRGVVNNTGIIEANSLDGINGHVELFAHGGTANIAGTIKAKGGFIETSGKELNVASTTSIEASKWLLDPTNMIIESTGGTDLSGGSVSATAIQSALSSADVELQADQDITVNENITWGDATKLTLTAGDEIYVNATIENTNNTNGGVYFNAVNRNAAIKFDATTGKVIINNINQLQWISQALNGNYELGSNIDASDTRNWNSDGSGGYYGFKQIGDQSTNNIDTRFTGNFDGKGHVIDGLYINRGSEDYVGLFGYITNSAKISNLGLTNVDIKAGDRSGGLVGYTNGATISNVGLTNLYIEGSYYIGGLIGSSYGNTSISNSYVIGEVIGLNGVGGLIAEVRNSNTTINTSYTNTTLGSGPNMGGLVGMSYNDLSITNSYAIGDITGSYSLGGLVGVSYYNLSITNSYATGRITGTDSLGGLVGAIVISDTTNTINNSYYDRDTTGVTSGVGSFGAGASYSGSFEGIYSSTNTVNAFNQATYAGFDFTNDWFMIEGETRPFLRSEYSTTITNDHQLQLMAMDLTANYTLANDIKYTGNMWSSKGFSPIGNNSTYFTGNFDGLGHTISDVLINRPATDDVGLFGDTDMDSVIQNVALIGGSVSGDGSVGSLVGKNRGTIQNSYATGSVTGTSISVGGLVGENIGTIQNSYATGSVNGASRVGGLVGYNFPGTIENSYAIGSVSGSTDVGGLVGTWVGGTITDSYWDIDTTGQASSSGGIGLTTVQMQQQANFTGFDFTNDWIIYEGHTRPLLRTFMTELTVKANDHTRTYDGTNYNGSSGVTYSNPTYDSSLVQGSLNYTSSDDLRNAGTATVNVDGLYSSQHGYIINYDTGTLTTNKKDITVNYTAENKVYDGTTNAVVNGTLNGIVSGDSVTSSNTSANFTDKNVGNSKTVNIDGIFLEGIHSGNYSISGSATASANITPKVITADYIADNKVYDGTTDAVVNGTLAGIISGDTVTVSNTTANFTDKNAGENKTVNIAGISLSGDDASNYSIANTSSTTANITPKAITADYIADNKVYDGTTDAVVNGTLAGIISGDTVTVSNTSANFTDKNAGTGKTVNIAGVSIGGVDSGNYTISNTSSTTADITKKELTANYTADNKIYDGTTSAVVSGTLDGVLSGETVTFSNATANFADKNAGDEKIVNVAGISISGDDSGNYSISNTSSTTADITKKDITANYTAENKVYDGNTDAIVSGTLAGIISGDSVTLSENASFVDKNVGTGIAINGLSLDGIDSGNYFISSSNSATADITPRVLKLEASKEYDGTDDLTGFVTLGNLVGAETLEYTGAKANSKDSGNNNFISSITLADGENGGLVSNYELPSLLAHSSNNSVTIEEKPSLSDVITPIANQTVLTNKDIEALLKSGIDIKTIFQQLNSNEIALIPGIVMRVLDGGINLPYGSKQQFSLENDNDENEDNSTI